MSDSNPPLPLAEKNAISRPKFSRYELPESDAGIQSLLEAIPIPMLLVRMRDSQILFANHRVTEYFDVIDQSIVGRTTKEFYLHHDDRQKLTTLLEKEGRVGNFEVQMRSPAGKAYWVSVSIQLLAFRNEICALGGLVDLTARKEAELSFSKERRLLSRLLEFHERDRQLIGFEIHDGIVQDMTASTMFLEGAIGDLERANQEVPENLTRSLSIVRDCINEARRLINGLQPPVLDEAGVVIALETMIRELQDKSNLQISFTSNVQFRRLAPALEMAIYRIVQEALNNVWQHSGTDSATVELAQAGDRVTVQIKDAGKGFDPNKVKKKRYGITGIRERARLLGGYATIESAPGKGTRIEVHLPITDLLQADDNLRTTDLL